MTGTWLRSLVVQTRRYPWVVPALLVLGLAASLAEGLGIGLLIPVLDDLTGGTTARGATGPVAARLGELTNWIPREYRLPVLAAMIVGLVAVKAALLITNTAVSSWVSGRVAHDLRAALCERMLRSDYGYASRLDQGRMINLFEHQADRVGEAMTLLSNMLVASSTLVVFAVLLALLSWQLALIVVAVVLPVSLFVRSMTRRSSRFGATLSEAYSVLSRRIVEVVGLQRTIRLFGGEQREAGRFEEASNAVRRAWFRTLALSGAIQPLVEFMYVPVFILVLVFALRAGIGLSTLFAFLALLYRLQTPLKRLDHLRVDLSGHGAAIDEISGLLAEADRHPQCSGARRSDGLARGIEFDHVSYQFLGDDRLAVQDVSFTMRCGTVTALVGKSGAGKSTLVNLLCRLYEPSSGRVLVDGAPLADYETASWRQRLAFAGQDAELLFGTVRENVAWGRPDASTEQVTQALLRAGALSFVAALPDGLDTNIGTAGSTLSGGQRQRIALARAFIREPELLILDEATNAVDNVTEAEIQAAIDGLAGQCTILLIAHRLATLRRADQVVVLDGGRVVECGSPAELLAAGGLLARQHALN